MFYVIGYFVVGLLLCFLFRTEDDNPAFFDTTLAIAITLLWPFVTFYMATKIKNIKWKGKIVWEKKK